MRVLLIGGYSPLVKTLQQALAEEGFAAVIANGEEADDKVRSGDCDVVVLDLLGSRDTGRCLVERWQRSNPKTRVLVLATPGPDGEADGWLTKPFALDEFLARLRTLMDEPHTNNRT
jgi:DNA-binding response OmpR family regulator